MRISRWIIPALLCGLVTWGFAQKPSSKVGSSKDTAAKPAKKPAAENKRKAKKPTPTRVTLTPAREAAALKFAEIHHPELHDLLSRLKKNNRKQFLRATMQLYLASERIARMKERSPERYELSLEEWKLDSRLRLLVARMSMNDDNALDAELQSVLERRMDVRLKLLKQDRERQAARLKKLDEQISAIQDDREETARKDLQRVKRSLGLLKPRAAKTKPVRIEN